MKENLILRTIGCGLISFVFCFVWIPVLFGGVSDAIWISVLIAVPSILGVVLLRKVERYLPLYVAGSALIQYVLLVALAGFVSRLWGCSIERALGWFEYIGVAFLWPAIIGALQWGVLDGLRKIRGK